jgi:hypothetical protein
MNAGDIVIAVLQNPREQVWGVLQSLNAAGLIIRGLNTRNFEEWSRQVSSGGQTELGPETTFFPAHRIERISLDQPIGSVPSLGERFEEISGVDPLKALDNLLD